MQDMRREALDPLGRTWAKADRIGDQPRYMEGTTCVICQREIDLREVNVKTDRPEAEADWFYEHVAQHNAKELAEFASHAARRVRAFRLVPEGPSETPR